MHFYLSSDTTFQVVEAINNIEALLPGRWTHILPHTQHFLLLNVLNVKTEIQDSCKGFNPRRERLAVDCNLVFFNAEIKLSTPQGIEPL